MDISLALERQALVDAIEALPDLGDDHTFLSPPHAAVARKRAALVRKLEQFDVEHPEIAHALQNERPTVK